MTKVCHMTSAHQALDDRVFCKECVSLVKNGYETYLITQGESQIVDGVHIIGIGTMPTSRLSRMTSWSKEVYEKALEVDADIYHFHDPELLPYGVKLKRKGKIVIFDSHERYTEQLKSKPYLPAWITRIIAKLYGLYEKHALKIIDAVIFPCTIEGKNPFLGMCDNVAIISNYSILDEFYNLYEEGIEKKSNSVCYVGGLTESRGIMNDVKASYKANATLNLAGEFSPESFGELVKNSKEFKCVKYLGQINRKEIREILQKSQIGVCTLLNSGQYFKIDTFGIKVFEYMAMGLPVIVSNTRYGIDFINKYKVGICVDPDNVDEIAKAIRYILDNPEEAKVMGENGRKAIKNEFNWSVEEKKLFDLYNKLLEEKA